MAEESLCTELLEKIKSKSDADEIVRKFYELHGGLSSHDLFSHRLRLLRAATEHDHTELRILLLANTRYGDPSDVSCHDDRSNAVHTTVYDHEIVRLLLSGCVTRKQEGVRLLLSADPTTFKAEHGRINPLECFAGLGKLFYSRELSLALPEIVQLFIDAGADVYSESSSGVIPLNCLMKEVEDMMIDDVDLATEGRHAILETTRILLEAGSREAWKYTQEPIDHLLTLRVYTSSLLKVRQSSQQYKLISALYELLLAHIVMTNANETFVKFLCQAAVISWEFEFFKKIRGYSVHCNPIIESFANILRCISLSVRDVEIPEFLAFQNSCLCISGARIYGSAGGNWNPLFQHIAFYASQPGRSTKLIELLLNILSESDIVKLRDEIRQFLVKEAQNPPGVSTTTKIATSRWTNSLEWIDKVNLPFRLEHLASRAVKRAMSSGGLRNILRLSLPYHIEQYVLLNLF